LPYIAPPWGDVPSRTMRAREPVGGRRRLQVTTGAAGTAGHRSLVRGDHQLNLRAMRLRATSTRMELPVHLEQEAPVHRGVDLRRDHRCVAKQLLHDAQVGAAGEEMGGERVPKHVRAHAAREPRCA
jgi:hypothetical protein